MNRIYLILVLIIMGAMQLSAQGPEDLRLSNNLVVKNVQIITKAGSNPFRGDIVIENGIITQVGTSSRIPNDAIIIAGDSLFAYPSFIDAYSHTGVPKADKKDESPKVSNPDKPSYERAGITPRARVEDQLDISDKSVESMRSMGFGLSHIAPRGGMIAGQGAIILLTDKNQSPYVSKSVSMNGSMESAKGRVYPSTIIGVMAKYRDLVNQAKNAKQHEDKYLANPVGLVRPNYDEEIQSLYATVSGNQPYFMKAEEAIDIHRIIELNKSLGLPIILVEVKEAKSALSKIKDNRISVLISLDLPDTVKIEKVDSSAIPDLKKQALQERKISAVKAHHENTMAIFEQGIPFAFSFLEVDTDDIPKQLDNIRKTGVSDEIVFRALTQDAANILGISSIAGSIEKGKLGNVLLTTKPIFEEGRHIQYNIVEGIVYKYDKKEKKKGKNAGTEGLSGTWSVVATLGDTEETGTLILKDKDGELSGTLTSSDGEESELKEISWDGKNLKFSFDSEINESMITMAVDMLVKGESMTGTISIGPMGSFPIEGTKTTPKR